LVYRCNYGSVCRVMVQLSEIVNNSDNLIGAFTSDSIGEVIYQGNPEIMAKYIRVLPMEGTEGVGNALYVKQEGSVGAIIAMCKILLMKMNLIHMIFAFEKII